MWATSGENLFMFIPYVNNKDADQPVHLSWLSLYLVANLSRQVFSLHGLYIFQWQYSPDKEEIPVIIQCSAEDDGEFL